MQANTSKRKPRISIRVGSNSLCFATPDGTLDQLVAFEPYIIKSGVSMAANLRQAFKTSDILQRDNDRALVIADARVLTVPAEEYDEKNADILYRHCFCDTNGETVMACALPSLNAMALYGINSDLKMVVEDHYRDVRFVPRGVAVCNYLHRRGLTGSRRKLYGYFHDGKLETACFDKTRLKFYNQFEAQYSRDAAYYLLYVWKQLALDSTEDEMFLCGEIPDRQWVITAMRNYLHKVYAINPAADFNRAPVTKIAGMPMDTMLTYLDI